jgi:hypothetical protein
MHPLHRRTAVGSFSKTPDHLAVIIDCGEQCSTVVDGPVPDDELPPWLLDRLAQIVTWADTVGVRAVTMYDAEGFLKCASGRVEEAIEQERHRAKLADFSFVLDCDGHGGGGPASLHLKPQAAVSVILMEVRCTRAQSSSTLIGCECTEDPPR